MTKEDVWYSKDLRITLNMSGSVYVLMLVQNKFITEVMW